MRTLRPPAKERTYLSQALPGLKTHLVFDLEQFSHAPPYGAGIPLLDMAVIDKNEAAVLTGLLYVRRDVWQVEVNPECFGNKI